MTGGEWRINEALAEAAARVALSTMREVLARYDSGAMTLGQALLTLDQYAGEGARVVLTAGWPFLDERVA